MVCVQLTHLCFVFVQLVYMTMELNNGTHLEYE